LEKHDRLHSNNYLSTAKIDNTQNPVLDTIRTSNNTLLTQQRNME